MSTVQVDQLQRSLSQYELAYRELDESKKELVSVACEGWA